ncbi:MAG: hypothetical protein Phyf2KO_19640 [Phycisphaerales bacterium]
MSVVSPSTSQIEKDRSTSEPLLWRDGVNVGLLALVAVGLGVLFFRWFFKQSEFSSHQIEDWGHAFFVPVISGYMIWQRRHEIAQEQPRVFWPALVAIIAGILGYLTFSIGPIPGVHMGQGLFVILTIWASALLLLGPGVIRWLMLPTAYLVFMITVSEGVMLRVTWPLQLLASQGAYVLLGLLGMAMGFTVDVDGNVLTVISKSGVEHPLNVAEACSGMRMVVAFIALGAAVALLSTREWWKRITLFMLCVPVALLMNIVRVAVLGFATLGDANLAQGEAHTLIGTLLLIPGLGLFLGIGWALEKIAPTEKAKKNNKAKPSAADMRFSLKKPVTGLLIVILFGSALGMGWAINYYKLHLDKLPIYPPNNRAVSTLPTETENWVQVGSDEIVSAEILEELGTSNYLTRLYREKNPADGEQPRFIELHAAYYTDQIDTVPHVPERCFTGAGIVQTEASREIPMNLSQTGWLVDEEASTDAATIYTARTSSKWSSVRGKRVRLPRGIEDVRLRASTYHNPGGDELYAGYFFIANGGVAASAEDVRLLAFDLGNDYAFYLKVQFNSQGVSSHEEFAELSAELLNDVLADLMLCVPDWVEVQAGRYPEGNKNAGSEN